MIINFSLSIQQANALLQLLGGLPTSSGAYPLLAEIKRQGDAFVSAAEAQKKHDAAIDARDMPSGQIVQHDQFAGD